jgi:hypothetical protein
VSAILDGRDFVTPELRALYDTLADALRSGPSLAAEDFINTLHPLLRSAAERACAMITQRDRDENHLIKDAREAAYRLKSLRLKDEMAELDALQREAEQARDSESLGALLERKLQLLVQKRAIDTASAGTISKPNKHAPKRHKV